MRSILITLSVFVGSVVSDDANLIRSGACSTDDECLSNKCLYSKCQEYCNTDADCYWGQCIDGICNDFEVSEKEQVQALAINNSEKAEVSDSRSSGDSKSGVECYTNSDCYWGRCVDGICIDFEAKVTDVDPLVGPVDAVVTTVSTSVEGEDSFAINKVRSNAIECYTNSDCYWGRCVDNQCVDFTFVVVGAIIGGVAFVAIGTVMAVIYLKIKSVATSDNTSNELSAPLNAA